MIVKCSYCNQDCDKSASHLNRAKKSGLNIYCNRTCAGFGRRVNITLSEKKALKAEYDRKYRENKALQLKAKKHEYFKKTYDPVKAAVDRKAKMHKHVEYCRKPEYKSKKKVYDKVYRAKNNFGEFWESALLLEKIGNEIDDREVRQINNLHNKSLKRKRKWQQLQKLNYLRVT